VEIDYKPGFANLFWNFKEFYYLKYNNKIALVGWVALPGDTISVKNVQLK
jgi:hypothetical protein